MLYFVAYFKVSIVMLLMHHVKICYNQGNDLNQFFFFFFHKITAYYILNKMATQIFSSEILSNVTNVTPNPSVTFNLGYWEHIFTAVLVALITVMGVVGNSMIIAAVAFSRKLQTSTNAFVTSLSVADLLTSFFLIWYMVGLLGRYEWPLPRAEWLCAVTGFVIFTCVATSSYNLAAIGMNRLILITRPHAYQRIFTSWKLGLFVALPWFVPCSFMIVFVLTGKGAFGFDKSDLSCGDLDLHKNAEEFNFIQTLVALPIPLTTIVVSYIWIYVYLKKHFHKQKENLTVSANNRSEVIQMSHENTEPSSCQIATSKDSIINKSCDSADEPFQSVSVSLIMETQSHGQNKTSTEGVTKQGSNITDKTSIMPSITKRKTISRQQIEITKNLFIVVCAFFACFFPYFVLNPILGSSHAIYYIRLLPLANSAINFAIYARKHPDFKVVLGCMMRCSYADIPQPSRLLKFLLSNKT